MKRSVAAAGAPKTDVHLKGGEEKRRASMNKISKRSCERKKGSAASPGSTRSAFPQVYMYMYIYIYVYKYT